MEQGINEKKGSAILHGSQYEVLDSRLSNLSSTTSKKLNKLSAKIDKLLEKVEPLVTEQKMSKAVSKEVRWVKIKIYTGIFVTGLLSIENFPGGDEGWVTIALKRTLSFINNFL